MSLKSNFGTFIDRSINELRTGRPIVIKENKNYLSGLNVYKGKITFRGVADAFNFKYIPPENIL